MTPATGKVKKFEVVRTVNIGGENGVREPGSEIKSTEVRSADIQELLELGYIRDADAPIPPSQAEGTVAFDRMLNLAVKIGAAKRDGAAYSVGTKSAKGLTAFRAAVSIDEIEAAILAAAKGE